MWEREEERGEEEDLARAEAGLGREGKEAEATGAGTAENEVDEITEEDET